MWSNNHVVVGSMIKHIVAYTCNWAEKIEEKQKRRKTASILFLSLGILTSLVLLEVGQVGCAWQNHRIQILLGSSVRSQ